MTEQAFRDPDYRPNPERCIYLSGEINQEKLDRLTPEILRLSSTSHAPITLYIDSPGGSTYSANILYRLLKARDQDSESSKLITVCTGVAASAAAGAGSDPGFDPLPAAMAVGRSAGGDSKPRDRRDGLCATDLCGAAGGARREFLLPQQCRSAVAHRRAGASDQCQCVRLPSPR